jgi:predicted DNA-binding transcriptional regulator AlpA
MDAKVTKIKEKNATHCMLYPVKQRLLSLKNAAIYLDRSEDSLRELIYSGAFPIIQLGERSKMWVDVGDLDRWIDSQKQVLGA